MTDFTMTTDADGIAVITWDCAEKSMNVLNWDALRTLDGFIDTVITDEAVKGAIITSGKKDFAAGMDLNVLADLRNASGDNPAQGMFDGVTQMHQILRKIERAGNSNVKVAAVSSYFPSGQVPMESKLLDTKYAIDSGADEIDIVINRKAFLEGDYRKVYDEIVALKEVCQDVHLKTILEVGDLKTYENIRKASIISLAAGSDFIKTSTGKLSIGSSRQACYVMLKSVLDYESMTGIKAGIKVAGGIRDAKDAIRYLVMINEEMGSDWLNPELFRFGASSLLDDVLKQIKKLKTGAYQAGYYFPRG